MTSYNVYQAKKGRKGWEFLGVYSGSSPEVVKNKIKEKQNLRNMNRGIRIYPSNYLTEFFPSDMK